MSPGVAVAVIVAGILVTGVCLLISVAVLLPNRRRHFSRSREAMDDDEFVTNLNAAAADHGVLALIRRIYATQCRVPAELLHNTDDCAQLESTLMFDGFDETDFLIELEIGLNCKIPDSLATRMPYYSEGRRIFGYSKKQTFGSWAIAIMSWLKDNRIALNNEPPQSPAARDHPR